MNYINGSDLLMSIGGQACGHCTSHTSTYSSETKDRAVKPAASEAKVGSGLWKEKTVTGLSVQVKCEGLRYYSEQEAGMASILPQWVKGAKVELAGFVRGSDASPYMKGSFVISSIEESNPAGDDASYNVTFDNSGPVTIDETAIDTAGDTAGDTSE